MRRRVLACVCPPGMRIADLLLAIARAINPATTPDTRLGDLRR